MANSTVLQIPNNLDDPVVLRRVLTLIVEKLDEIKGNRGDDAAATESQLVSTASNINELVQDLNSLDNNYLRKDGKNVALAPISYSKKFTLSGLNFASVQEVDSKLKEFESTLGDTFIEQSSATVAPLAGNTDPVVMSAKIDELLTALQTINILS